MYFIWSSMKESARHANAQSRKRYEATPVAAVSVSISFFLCAFAALRDSSFLIWLRLGCATPIRNSLRSISLFFLCGFAALRDGSFPSRLALVTSHPLVHSRKTPMYRNDFAVCAAFAAAALWLS